jgi:uncharacterized protein
MVSDFKSQIHIEIFDARENPPAHFQADLPIQQNNAPTIYDALSFLKIVISKNDPLFLKKNAVGVFGVPLGPDDTIYEGDRLEIYRPILIDPKKIRRKKANQNKDAELKNKAKIRKERKDLREI